MIRNNKITKLDVAAIPGTNCYLDDLAKKEVEEMIDAGGEGPAGIHFIGSGNYHYLTLLYLKRIEEDFILIHFDNHPDMKEAAFGGITSCGGWLLEAIETLPHLQRVYTIGVDHALMEELGQLPDQVVELGQLPNELEEPGWLSNEMEEPDRLPNELEEPDRLPNELEEPDRLPNEIEEPGRLLNEKILLECKDLPIYITFDEDVLSTEVLTCTWSQGNMTLQQAEEWLQQLITAFDVIGLDICSEWENLQPEWIEEQEWYR